MPESVNSSMPIQHVGVHWAQVARLAMVSQAAVFRDIVPGYRVRLPTEKELAMPVSKDVRRVRDTEAALLRAYQARCIPFPVCKCELRLVGQGAS